MEIKLGCGDSSLRNEIGRKISETKKRINKKIREIIIEPYIEELTKRGMGSLIYKDFRKHLYAELNHVVSQYKDRLSPKDIFNILVLALDDEYLRSIGKSTNIYIIFFNRNLSLVERYILSKKNPKIFYIKDSLGKIQDVEEWGYFIYQNDRFIHIPPYKKDALFYKISQEVENRLENISENSEFDSLFSGKILKQDELWRIGSPGENNRFVSRK